MIDNAVEIKGLERHLELRELQRQKEQDQRLREAEVFGLNHKFAVNADSCDFQQKDVVAPEKKKITVPEPFSLQTDLRH